MESYMNFVLIKRSYRLLLLIAYAQSAFGSGLHPRALRTAALGCAGLAACKYLSQNFYNNTSAWYVGVVNNGKISKLIPRLLDFTALRAHLEIYSSDISPSYGGILVDDRYNTSPDESNIFKWPKDIEIISFNEELHLEFVVDCCKEYSRELAVYSAANAFRYNFDRLKKVIMCVNSEPVGFGVYDLESGMIRCLCISKKHQGQGYSTDLINYILKQMAHENIESASLSVVPGNERAEIVYEKFGFKRKYRYHFVISLDKFKKDNLKEREPLGMATFFSSLANWHLKNKTDIVC